MAMHSLHALGDIGQQIKCDDNDTQTVPANYSMIKAYAESVPATVMLGFCLPSECDVDELALFADKV